MRHCIRLAVLSLLLSLLSSLAAAQSTTSLHGVISDPNGAVLPGATVKLNDPQTGFARTVTSGQDGVYQFLQIPPATYTVTVTAAGFSPIKREHVTLQVSGSGRVGGTSGPPRPLAFYASGESLMRKRVRTCSEMSSIAGRLATGSVWARYFMASTSTRCPST